MKLKMIHYIFIHHPRRYIYSKNYQQLNDSTRRLLSRLRLDFVESYSSISGTWILDTIEGDFDYSELSDTLILQISETEQSSIKYGNQVAYVKTSCGETYFNIFEFKRKEAKLMNLTELYGNLKGSFVYQTRNDRLELLNDYGIRLKFLRE